MAYTFDPKKSHKNKADPSRGFGFEWMEKFEWDTAIQILDKRREYGEIRYITYGMIEGRLRVAVWTPRDGGKRVISLRKANIRERKNYEEKIAKKRLH